MVISVRPKNRTRGVSFLKCRICCHPLLPPKTHSQPRKILNAIAGRCFSVIFTHLSSAPASFFFSFSLYAKPAKSFVTYFQKKKRKCTFRPAPRCSFEAHSVTTYHLNTRRFRLLGHIPHNLVDHLGRILLWVIFFDGFRSLGHIIAGFAHLGHILRNLVDHLGRILLRVIFFDGVRALGRIIAGFAHLGHLAHLDPPWIHRGSSTVDHPPWIYRGFTVDHPPWMIHGGSLTVGHLPWVTHRGDFHPRWIPTVRDPPWVTHGGSFAIFSPRPRNNQRSLKTKKKTALFRNTFQKPRPENISWRRLLEARTGSS